VSASVASPAALEVESLSVSYGRVRAVHDVSFRAPAGSLVALVGANGAGKTSTLWAAAGLLKPRSGRVLFHGHDVTGQPAHRLVSAGLVLVPEGRQILVGLTVHENLQLGAGRRDAGASRIDEMYALFPVLAQRRRAAAGSLSGGEQQMLAIARALVAGPTVLMMDEPSMGLAPRMVDEVFGVIARIRASGTTVVLVEQNARRALRIADYGYVMETGSVVHEGTGAALVGDARVVQAYLGLD
jgi:branched-chain amino acid transport system ATP-binding protein